MRTIREMTDQEIVEIASLALENITTFDVVSTVMSNMEPEPPQFRIGKELWDEKDNLMVVRAYLHGRGNTHCAIWEMDDENRLDITVVEDDEVSDVANIVMIVKKLIEWEFV
jgi:hypothetical protein